jgi:hypothetical protein
MKKIFTLLAGLFLTVAVFAADRRPSVTINTMKNFRVVVDGRSFYGNSNSIQLPNAYSGRHTIQVFEMKRGFFGRTQERMVSARSFRLDRNDLMINVDFYGNISIKERFNRFDRGNNGRGYNDRDGRGYNDRDGRDNDRDFRDYQDDSQDRDYKNRDWNHDKK